MQVQTKCDLVLRLGTRYVFIECFPAFRVLSCPDLPKLQMTSILFFVTLISCSAVLTAALMCLLLEHLVQYFLFFILSLIFAFAIRIAPFGGRGE